MKRVLFTTFAVLLLSGCAIPRSPELTAQQDAKALIDSGTVHLRAGDLERARGAFSLSAELVPSAAALDGLGCVEFYKGNIGDAETYFVRALTLDPDYMEARANLALLFERQGRRAEARLLYEAVLRADPRNARARNNYSALLFDAAEQEGAKRELLKAAATEQSQVIEKNLKAVESALRMN
jgi:Tfp pilus assembly protein PilF